MNKGLWVSICMNTEKQRGNGNRSWLLGVNWRQGIVCTYLCSSSHQLSMLECEAGRNKQTNKAKRISKSLHRKPIQARVCHKTTHSQNPKITKPGISRMFLFFFYFFRENPKSALLAGFLPSSSQAATAL